MRTVILCGGMGTRLREETEYRPKPMVTVGGRPILWHILDLYRRRGFSDFLLCLGYRGWQIKEYFLNYDAINNDLTIRFGEQRHVECHGDDFRAAMSITMVDTGPETMTGGRLKRVESYVHDDTFMLTYGDGLTNIDIRKLVEFHRAHGKLATVTAVRTTSRFGKLEVGSGGRVEAFAEKPLMEDWISGGFFVFQRDIFKFLDGDDCILERQPLMRLAEAGQLMAFQHEGFFFAMDTYRDYQAINDLWNNGQRPWLVDV